MKVLVTGANGFVGEPLCRELQRRGHSVRAAVRRAPASPLPTDDVVLRSLGADTQWGEALRGVDAVIHLAARVHQMSEAADQAESLYRATNVGGTLQLAREAVRYGVRRLVFMSSIKVHGDETNGTPASERVEPRPTDAYGRSKWAAEQALRSLEGETALEVVTLRPPLVFGPGVGANFRRLMFAVDRGIPLPLGGIENRRSLVFVENLASAAVECAESPAAAGRTFAVSDEPAVSTPELIRMLAAALGRSPRLISIPPALLRVAGRATGRTTAVDRLLGSLVVDSSGIRETLGWTPPVFLTAGIERTALWFSATKAPGSGV